MAVYVFKGTGWFLSGLAVALGGYMVMSQGAAERARLRSLDYRIIQAQKDIRNLETEFSTRANLATLERWNGEGIGMAAPAPQQFVASEADLDRLPQAPIEKVALVVPTGAPKVQTETAVASRDPNGQTAQTRAMPRADVRKVAMVDRGSLISPTVMGDIERSADSERQNMR